MNLFAALCRGLCWLFTAILNSLGHVLGPHAGPAIIANLATLLLPLLAWQLLYSLPGVLMAWLASEPTAALNNTSTTSTPAISGLSTGVTACGMYVSTMVASLVSASSTAPAAASMATYAFGDLGLGGLAAADIFQKDWQGAALTASGLSSSIVGRFYRELEHQQKGLEYVLHVAGHVSAKIRDGDGDAGQGLGALFRGSELRNQRRVSQRVLGYFLNLAEHANSTCGSFHKDFTELELKLANMVAGKDAGEESDVGESLEEGIKKLNKKFDSKSTGWPLAAKTEIDSEQCQQRCQGAKVTAGPEQAAAFVKDLHTAQGAGSLFYATFQNARSRLRKLAERTSALKDQASKTGERLKHIDSAMGIAQTSIELQPFVDDMLCLAAEWRSRIKQDFYDEF